MDTLESMLCSIVSNPGNNPGNHAVQQCQTWIQADRYVRIHPSHPVSSVSNPHGIDCLVWGLSFVTLKEGVYGRLTIPFSFNQEDPVASESCLLLDYSVSPALLISATRLIHLGSRVFDRIGRM